MIALLLLNYALADVEVTYSIPQHHIAGQPLYVDLQLLNTSETAETIPDLGRNRWLVSFETNGPSGKQRLRSSKPTNAQEQTLTLRPRQVQEYRFEVPNAQAWSTNTYSVSIQTPLSTAPFQTSVTVHPFQQQGLDTNALRDSLFISPTEMVWQSTADDQQHLFVGLEEPRYFTSTPLHSHFGSSIHLGSEHHLYWVQKQNLHIQEIANRRLGNSLQISIPWPDFEPIGTPFTDDQGRFLFPIWVPKGDSDTGTLHVIYVTNAGQSTFRKVYTGKKPTQTLHAINQANTPLIVVQTKNAAWLFALTEVGDPKIDALPPNSVAILKTRPTETLRDISFGISETHGLHLITLRQKTVDNKSQYSRQSISLQGTEIETAKEWFSNANLHDIWLVEQNLYVGGVQDKRPLLTNQNNDILWLHPVQLPDHQHTAWQVTNQQIGYWSKENELWSYALVERPQPVNTTP